MKKISLLVFSVSLTILCTACGRQAAAPSAPAEETLQQESEQESEQEAEKEEKEDVFADVNELEPVNGVYQIHSIVGLQNIAEHLDGTFEVLCDIDLDGAVWTPVGTEEKPFTGTIKGNEHTISNFTIESSTADGQQAFVGVNDGLLMQVNLSDVTIAAADSARNIGLLAGINNGRLQRCSVSGTLNAEKLGEGVNIGGAAGYNKGDIRNSVVKLDTNIDKKGALNLGGLAGLSVSGSVLDSETHGSFEVADGTDKNIGFFVGQAENCEVLRCTFMGETNQVGGTLCTDFFGASKKVSSEKLLYRDNSAGEIPQEQRELRNQVVQRMYDMGTILWTTPVQINTECVAGCTAGLCHTALLPEKVYRGIPYKHSASTLERMEYCLDENNCLKDWVVEQGPLGGFQTYMGSDCYRSVQLAWSTVANSVNSSNCMEAILYGDQVGAIGVGSWSEKWTTRLNDQYTAKCVTLCGEQAIMEDYAQMRAGDCLIMIGTGGAHAIMVSEDPVVVRDEEGNIDPVNSYIYNHEQGGDNNTSDEWVSSWGIDNYKTFTRLLGDAYLPVTIRELTEGVTEEVKGWIEEDADGILGLTTGIVKSNYFVDSVTMEITDDKGEEVFAQKMFARIDKVTDYGSMVSMFERTLVKEFDLAEFSQPLQEVEFTSGQEYHCTLTVGLHTLDEIVVKEFSFKG